MSAKSRRFIPRLDILDDRCVPAVLVELQGTVLTITGDAGDNSITITDTGKEAVYQDPGERFGGITVVADGETFLIDTEVTAILVNTFAGADSVVYDLTDFLAVTRLIDVQLGKGADTFTANLTGQVIDGESTNVAINAYGQGGGDTLVLNAEGVTVNPGARLDVYFEGAAGRDAITFNHSWVPTLPDNVTLKKDQRR